MNITLIITKWKFYDEILLNIKYNILYILYLFIYINFNVILIYNY